MERVRIVSRQQLADLAVVSKGQLEIIDWLLYDTLSVTSTTTSLRFFQQAFTGAVTLETTNMELAGQLPSGYQFLIQKVVAQPLQATTLLAVDVVDAYKISHKGRAILKIGGRDYFQCPIQVLLGGGFMGFGAVAASATQLSLGYVAPRTILNGELEDTPLIPNTYNFAVTLDWDSAPTVSATTSMRIILAGKLVRPVQG